MIDRDRLATTLIDLIRIRSMNPFDAPPAEGFREQEMAEHLMARLKAFDLETGWRDVVPGRPNIWGRLKGTGDGPTIMLAAHMDTVGVEGYDSAFDPQLRNGRITGRGSCDMKGAFACYFEVLHMLRAQSISLSGDLIIAGLADEEHQMIGSIDMGRNGPHADFAIIGEPTRLEICRAHKGQLAVRIQTHGKAAHSSSPENGINAVEHMARVITHLSGLNEDLQTNGPRHPLCGTPRFSMNVVQGGTFVSGIPDLCELEVDRRFLPQENPEALLEEFRSRMRDLEQIHPEMCIEVTEPALLVHGLDVPETSPLVQALVEASAAVLGHPAPITAFPGGTDAPNLNFPCIICGPGDLAQAHSTDEYISLDQMEQASAIYFNAILSLNGLPILG